MVSHRCWPIPARLGVNILFDWEHTMKRVLLLSLGLALASPLAGWAQNRGLSATPEQLTGARWQARLERDVTPLAAGPTTPLWLLGNPARPMVRVLGDYQSSLLRLGATGGLRLTGGVLLNLRQSATVGGVDINAGPLSGTGYAGVGYSSGGAAGDWGFTADLGLTALRFGTAGSGLGLRDDRPQPMLRLGVNLQF